jgi:ring-1,2-phenylacetyl-CoA epoxidase subunit PaaD
MVTAAPAGGRPDTTDLERARAAAASVVDPELPMLTIADLGVLRSVEVEDGGRVVVTVTPTYTGCPAMATIKADVRLALAAAGLAEVEVRTALTPAWTTDWLTDRARELLGEHGIAPPGRHAPGPVDLPLLSAPAQARCPRCGSTTTREVSRFGPTPCTAQHVCGSCGEPFERMKDL